MYNTHSFANKLSAYKGACQTTHTVVQINRKRVTKKSVTQNILIHTEEKQRI